MEVLHELDLRSGFDIQTERLLTDVCFFFLSKRRYETGLNFPRFIFKGQFFFSELMVKPLSKASFSFSSVYIIINIYINCCGSILSAHLQAKHFFKHYVKLRKTLWFEWVFSSSFHKWRWKGKSFCLVQCFICMLQIKKSCLTLRNAF